MSEKPSYKDLEKRIEGLSKENQTLKRAEERITEEKAKGLEIKAFVMKPIIQAELANIIRQVLDKG